MVQLVAVWVLQQAAKHFNADCAAVHVHLKVAATVARHFKVQLAVRACPNQLVQPVGDRFAPFRRLEDVPAGSVFALNRVGTPKAPFADASVDGQREGGGLWLALRTKVDAEVVVLKLRHAACTPPRVPPDAFDAHNLDWGSAVKPEQLLKPVLVQLLCGSKHRRGSNPAQDNVGVGVRQLDADDVAADQPALPNHLLDQPCFEPLVLRPVEVHQPDFEVDLNRRHDHAAQRRGHRRQRRGRGGHRRGGG